MSIGTSIIKAALKEIGADSVAQPDDSEAVEIGMNVLNSMYQLWLSQRIDLGIVPLEVPGDELGEPLDSRQVIIDNLAIALAPNFDNGNTVVSNALISRANLGYAIIKRLYQRLTIPDKVISSTLPTGAGNTRGRFNNTFAGSGAKIPSSNA